MKSFLYLAALLSACVPQMSQPEALDLAKEDLSFSPLDMAQKADGPIIQSVDRLVALKWYPTVGRSLDTVVYYDTKEQTECGFRPTSDGQTRCLPVTTFAREVAMAGYFRDAACSQPVGLANKGTCAQPKYATTYTPTCPTNYVFYSVTGPTTVTAIYSKTGAVCQDASSLLSAYNIVALSPSPIPPTDFVAAELR